MTDAAFTLSAFGDEIAPKLHDQIRVLHELEVRFLDLREVWGKNVLDLDDDEARKIRHVCAGADIGISCLGTPIGKSPIEEPIEAVLDRLQRLFAIAEIVGTQTLRVFSFYPPPGSGEDDLDALVTQSASRLSRLAEAAATAGFNLLLENEKGIVGDTIGRCHALLTAIDSSSLNFVWDPANFVQVGERAVTEDGWPLLGNRTTSIHVKDAMLADGAVRPAGQGDGQVAVLLRCLRDEGYQGYLALEPHLAVAGHSGGFSGPDGMKAAVEALRGIMSDVGCVEA